jgi:hypothetical protein
MPSGLHRSYGAHHLHFVTCSCYRRLVFSGRQTQPRLLSCVSRRDPPALRFRGGGIRCHARTHSFADHRTRDRRPVHGDASSEAAHRPRFAAEVSSRKRSRFPPFEMRKGWGTLSCDDIGTETMGHPPVFILLSGSFNEPFRRYLTNGNRGAKSTFRANKKGLHRPAQPGETRVYLVGFWALCAATSWPTGKSHPIMQRISYFPCVHLKSMNRGFAFWVPLQVYSFFSWFQFRFSM